MLFLSHTTLSVPALMGSIMCVGVATANSILVVTFANDQRAVGRDANDAALAAGMTRLRPVVMTALAMIIGMLPMSLGLGEGGEQNAPLGRAVIGGLLLATMTTLFFVPVMYSLLRASLPRRSTLSWRTHDAPRRRAAAGPAPDRARSRARLRSPAARDDLESGAWSPPRSAPPSCSARRSRSATFRAIGSAPRSRRRRRAPASRPCESTSSRPKIGSSDRAVALPGSVQPLMETVLYARASGFVRRWLVDMGDKVAAGQLLAEIETPELDQELDQARAQLGQAQPVARCARRPAGSSRTRTCSATSS